MFYFQGNLRYGKGLVKTRRCDFSQPDYLTVILDSTVFELDPPDVVPSLPSKIILYWDGMITWQDWIKRR